MARKVGWISCYCKKYKRGFDITPETTGKKCVCTIRSLGHYEVKEVKISKSKGD